MKHYIYTNYKTGCVVFECDADSLLAADRMLLDTTGIVAEKANNLGVSWEKKTVSPKSRIRDVQNRSLASRKCKVTVATVTLTEV